MGSCCSKEKTPVLRNKLWIEVIDGGTDECNGVYKPHVAEAGEKSESGTPSRYGYWNGKMAWDRADGSATRNPSLSYSNSYKSWRIAKLDGGLAYSFASGDDLPPTDQPFTIYNGLAPAPTLIIHKSDPRLKVPVWDMLFDK